jgi:hypothetical protein
MHMQVCIHTHKHTQTETHTHTHTHTVTTHTHTTHTHTPHTTHTYCMCMYMCLYFKDIVDLFAELGKVSRKVRERSGSPVLQLQISMCQLG